MSWKIVEKKTFGGGRKPLQGARVGITRKQVWLSMDAEIASKLGDYVHLLIQEDSLSEFMLRPASASDPHARKVSHPRKGAGTYRVLLGSVTTFFGNAKKGMCKVTPVKGGGFVFGFAE